MDGTNPKVSFIPKGSLVREESFLERRRPQSAIGFLAIATFTLAVGAYAGLYYYNGILNKEVAQKTIEIKKAQKEFSDEPKVAEAKVFRARADLARELLNAHTVTSPVLTFLSENTTESILYNNFSFKNGPEGAVLDLTGEAQTYASLAYQTDVLRLRTKELSKFSVSNISLTKFGNVTFSFTMTFKPDYLLYTNNLENNSSNSDIVAPSEAELVTEPAVATNVTAPVAPSSINTTIPEPQDTAVSASLDTSLGNDWSVATVETSTTTEKAKAVGGAQSVLRSLWSKFKFW